MKGERRIIFRGIEDETTEDFTCNILEGPIGPEKGEVNYFHHDSCRHEGRMNKIKVALKDNIPRTLRFT